MEQEAIFDLAKLAELEPGFAELKAWPNEFSITAAMWPMLSQRMKDALEADICDLIEAGIDLIELKNISAVEYSEGKLRTVTIRVA